MCYSTLQAGHSLPDDELIANAKAMMIQVAQFGMDQIKSAVTSDGSPTDEVIQAELSG